MLKRLILSMAMAIILSGFSFSSAFAQSFFGAAPAGNNAAPSSGQVMTTDDFNKKVNELNNNSLNRMNQNINQQLKPMPPAPTLTPPPTPQPSGSETNAPAASAPSTSTAGMGPTSTTAPAPTTPLKPSSSPGSSDVYTGFGSSSPDKNKTPKSSSGSSGGWNVQY